MDQQQQPQRGPKPRPIEVVWESTPDPQAEWLGRAFSMLFAEARTAVDQHRKEVHRQLTLWE